MINDLQLQINPYAYASQTKMPSGFWISYLYLLQKNGY